ncbi:hypothetical protein F5148DRAFT_329255 [Russula earlei]|uniref:Uncharacterized protein n=1 Tax=Russula earlei TaxID=71964 RepID=A0ACC0U447_9AGAM|nr:hypothetical protein F5148DRAFT_329255 [Russula earlei]
MLRGLPQSSPRDATKPTARRRLQQKQQLYLAPPRRTTTDSSTHSAHPTPLHYRLISSTLTPSSLASLLHAPAYDDSIVPLFVASTQQFKPTRFVNRKLAFLHDRGPLTAAATTTARAHTTENSTLDGLTGDSQISCPWAGLGRRCIADCGWPRNSFIHHRPHRGLGALQFGLWLPLSCRLPHAPGPRPQSSPPPIAACQRSYRRRRLDTSRHPWPLPFASDFLSYACLSCPSSRHLSRM